MPSRLAKHLGEMPRQLQQLGGLPFCSALSTCSPGWRTGLQSDLVRGNCMQSDTSNRGLVPTAA